MATESRVITRNKAATHYPSEIKSARNHFRSTGMSKKGSHANLKMKKHKKIVMKNGSMGSMISPKNSTQRLPDLIKEDPKAEADGGVNDDPKTTIANDSYSKDKDSKHETTNIAQNIKNSGFSGHK